MPASMRAAFPIKKAMDDALVAYAQNGEPIRPEQGYPLRLFLPGWEGNTNVKWLRRLKALDQPAMTREETSKYTDLMPDGTARQFTFDMEPKSIITRPSGGDTVARGAHPPDYRHRMVRPRDDRQGRGHHRWRRDMEHGGIAVAGSTARAHAISLVVDLERRRDRHRIALHGRHRLYAAAAGRADPGSRHELAVSQQRHPGLEDRGRRKDHEW